MISARQQQKQSYKIQCCGNFKIKKKQTHVNSYILTIKIKGRVGSDSLATPTSLRSTAHQIQNQMLMLVLMWHKLTYL